MRVVVALLAKADGEQDTELIWRSVTSRSKLWVPPFRLAVRSEDVFALTAATVAVKELLVRAAILTPLGTVMLALLLDNATVTPPVGGCSRFSVSTVQGGGSGSNDGSRRAAQTGGHDRRNRQPDGPGAS